MRVVVIWFWVFLMPLSVFAESLEEIPYPRVLYGNPADIQLTGDSIFIRASQPLLQVELDDGLVVSMSKGTTIRVLFLDRDSGHCVLRIENGVVLVTKAGSTKVHALEEGHYPTSLRNDGRLEVSEVRAGTLAPSLFGGVQGFQIGDMVLTQQDHYINSLRINISAINSALVSVINGFFGHR